MTTSSPSPNRTITGREPVAITRPSDRAADVIWRRLCEGFSTPWLEEIGAVRADGDDFEASMDIWSVALTAALRNPEYREVAGVVLTRLRRMD